VSLLVDEIHILAGISKWINHTGERTSLLLTAVYLGMIAAIADGESTDILKIGKVLCRSLSRQLLVYLFCQYNRLFVKVDKIWLGVNWRNKLGGPALLIVGSKL